MGNLIQTGLDILVKVVDAVPFLKKYRTAILITMLAVLAVLDVVGVGPGDLYKTASPFVLPLITLTALAHNNVISIIKK